MTAYATGANVHPTLTGTAADAVTLTGARYAVVYNADPSNALYFRFDGTTAVAAAAGTYIVPVRSSLTVDLFPSGISATAGAVLSIVGNGNVYSVMSFS